MSDTVIVSMISAITSVVSLALGILSQIIARRGEQHAQETKTAFQETKAAITNLEQNTNGLKDELVKATAESNRAVGKQEGRDEHIREIESKKNGD